MDYENLYKDAVSKIKSIIADKKKQGLTNCLFEGDLNEIFPELKESEDERIRMDIISYLQHESQVKRFIGDIEYDKWIAWLEKQGEQTHAWGDEDEKIMKHIDSLLYCQCTIHSSMYEKLHNWLKSLKPQSHWKPTEEQLMALRDAIDNNEMESLYNDLKKL